MGNYLQRPYSHSHMPILRHGSRAMTLLRSRIGGWSCCSNQSIVLRTDPEWDDYGEAVLEFHLTYQGILLGSASSNPRAKHKHEIRRVLHSQLKRLWQVHPVLKGMKTDGPGITPDSFEGMLAGLFSIGNYNFVPLVSRRLNLACGLQVLFLRPDAPGDILRSGDIDNRLKTLFDALRTPKNTGEFGGYEQPEDSEKPFYCLLEDDSLVSQISVDTGILLQEVNEEFQDNTTRLVITVTLKPFVTTYENIGF